MMQFNWNKIFNLKVLQRRYKRTINTQSQHNTTDPFMNADQSHIEITLTRWIDSKQWTPARSGEDAATLSITC